MEHAYYFSFVLYFLSLTHSYLLTYFLCLLHSTYQLMSIHMSPNTGDCGSVALTNTSSRSVSIRSRIAPCLPATESTSDGLPGPPLKYGVYPGLSKTLDRPLGDRGSSSNLGIESLTQWQVGMGILIIPCLCITVASEVVPHRTAIILDDVPLSLAV